MGKNVYVIGYVKGLQCSTNRGWPKGAQTEQSTERRLNLCKANQKAFCKFILACYGDIVFGIVEKSVTMDLPNGDTNLVWNSLKLRFDPYNHQTSWK